MDLRSVLNTSDNGDRRPSKAPPTPQQQPQSRPSQSPAPYGYREYAQAPPHPSPGKPNAGPQHAARPSQVHLPHHPGSFHDPRSPGGMPAPAQSPYRLAPTPNHNPDGSSGHPFPPTQASQIMTSPHQRHQHTPVYYAQQPQNPDAYPQREASLPPGNYVQQHQLQVPQTPPISTATGPSQQYLHQRSQSTQSTPTPNSTHSQHQFGPPHAHGSPVQPTRANSEHRHPSQPPTPLGPPQSTATRPHPGQLTSLSQLPSSYQQRMASVSNGQPPQSPAQANASLRRVSGPTHRELPAGQAHQRSRSLQSREQSPSVSPRTRVTSIASSSDRVMVSPVDNDKKAPAPNFPFEVDRVVTPAKRKLGDRYLSPKELEHKEPRPPPGDVNGSDGTNAKSSSSSSSASASKKKRVCRSQPPIWAQDAAILGIKMPNQANFVLQKRAHSHLNGRMESTGNCGKTDQPSRHASPDVFRASTSATAKPASLPTAEPGPQSILGPWEASITGIKPYEEMSKTVADFIFIHVVNNPDIKEIMSRGVQFEIEAKLGTLIDKDTNYRVDRLLDTECVLHDNGRVAFRSSMTEAHHKAFNDFLNQVVIQTDPRAPNGAGRVQVHYKHRREIDRYFELTPELQSRLPGCVRSRLGSRVRNVKARVTYDQKTGQVLNKIVKARVADIDIHMPTNPMDCRLSINLEMDWDGPSEELEQLGPPQFDKSGDRQKDRLSYTQGHYQIDLTQVTLSNAGPGNTQRTDKEHELEIELASPIVLDQGAKAMSGAPHRYQELIEGFLDNVRVLARKAREFG